MRMNATPRRFSALMAWAAILVASACGGGSFEAEMRAGLVEEEGYTEAEAAEVPVEWFELIAADICDKLERNAPIRSYEQSAIETAIKHRC